MLFEFKKEEKALYNEVEGFQKGNMFKDLYDPYKDYKPVDIKVKTKQEEALFILMMLCFAIDDLNLYLILHQDDQEAYNLFKTYIEKYKKIKDDYEKEFQVLDILDDTMGKYTYNSAPWPWEGTHV